MTSKRDLKKRVRARQERTGESYTSALAHVRSDRPALVPVVELVDLSAEAARLGLACSVAMFPALAERVDGGTVLARLRHALLATEGDPQTALLRRVLLRGEPAPVVTSWPLESFDEGRRFMTRARAGIGGASPSGRMLALHVDGRRGPEMAVCFLWPTPPPPMRARPPSLLLSTAEAMFNVDENGVWTIP